MIWSLHKPLPSEEREREQREGNVGLWLPSHEVCWPPLLGEIAKGLSDGAEHSKLILIMAKRLGRSCKVR